MLYKVLSGVTVLTEMLFRDVKHSSSVFASEKCSSCVYLADIVIFVWKTLQPLTVTRRDGRP